MPAAAEESFGALVQEETKTGLAWKPDPLARIRGRGSAAELVPEWAPAAARRRSRAATSFRWIIRREVERGADRSHSSLVQFQHPLFLRHALQASTLC